MRLTAKSRPTAKVVVLEGGYITPTLVDHFDLTSTEDEVPDQLHHLADGVRSRIEGLRPDRVVIRRADVAPKASNMEGPRLRLLAEGALASAARDQMSDVVLATAKDLATRTPLKKAELDARAGALFSGVPAEAAAAALSGLA